MNQLIRELSDYFAIDCRFRSGFNRPTPPFNYLGTVRCACRREPSLNGLIPRFCELRLDCDGDIASEDHQVGVRRLAATLLYGNLVFEVKFSLVVLLQPKVCLENAKPRLWLPLVVKERDR